MVCFCPCVVFGQVAQKPYPGIDWGWTLLSAVLGYCGCWCIPGVWLRRKHKHNADCTACLAYTFCTPCAIAQDQRNLNVATLCACCPV
jgi:Cys-rich protein (TIGR01571 family)